MKLIAPLFAAFCLLALAGCGFALRGTANMPFDSASIQLPEGDALRRELTALLTANGVRVTTPDQASAQIRFAQNNLYRQVLSVGANARVREFELVYDLAFSVTAADGQQNLNSTLNLRRDYSFDQAEVLGAANEEEYLRDEMIRDMAARIVQTIDLKSR